MNFRKLVIENPLHFEFKRGVRRFFGVSRSGALNTAVLVICVLFYAGLMLMVISYREFMSPLGIMFLQLFLLTFVVPSSLHATIAGEREKRTWDVLSVAPISNAQIVVGKFIGGLLMIAFISLLLLPATIISFGGDYEATLGKLIQGQFVVLGFCVFLAALSVYISSKAKRAFSAQLAIFAVLILGLLVWPMFASIVSGYNNEAAPLLMFHPYYALQRVWDTGMSWADTYQNYQPLFNGWNQLAVYLILATTLVALTIRTLVDNENGEGRRR